MPEDLASRNQQDQNQTGNSPAGNPPAGNPPAGNPPAENPPAGNPPAGQKNILDAASPVSVTVPGDNASPEEIAAFRKAIGVPDSADGYEISAPQNLPDGLGWNEDAVRNFKSFALEQGLTGKQAAAAVAYHTKMVSEQVAAAIAAHNANAEKTEAKLKTEFGSEYDHKIQQANNALRVFGLSDALGRAGLLADESVIRAMIRIGESFAESKLKGGDTPPSSAQARYDELVKNPKSPYFNDADPNHQQAVHEVSELLKVPGIKA